MLLQKQADLEDCSHDRWGTALRCYTDKAGCVVCNEFRSRSLDTDNTHYILELLCEIRFFLFIVSAVVKLSENEEGDWHSLQCSLRTTQHMTVLSRYVESRGLTMC
jgi:hypothetical protein